MVPYMFEHPIVMLIIFAIPALFLIGIMWEAGRKPKTISRTKTKQLVRKAVEQSNVIPANYRRYNF